MAKFCGNCGTPLEDNAKVCGKCGTPLDGVSADIPSLKLVDPQKQKKRRRIFKLIIGLAVLVIVAATSFGVVSQCTGYNGLLRKVMKAYENYDIDTLASLSSDMFYYYDEENVIDYYFERIVGDDLDNFEAAIGHNYKLSYKVKETYVMSERKVKEMMNQIQQTYVGYDINVIEKVVVADVTITATQGDTYMEQDRSVVMIKEDGSWKLVNIE